MNQKKQAYLFLSVGFLLAVFIGACSKSSSPTAPTSSSTSGNQLYAVALETNGSAQTIVGIQGPFANTSTTSYSFSLPTPPGGTNYAIVGVLDVADTFIIPSSSQTIDPAASNYGQFYPTTCPSSSPSPTLYTTSTSGIDLTMSNANGACLFGSDQSIYYSKATGSAVVLAGTITESGL